MFFLGQKQLRIALISEHGDPAIEIGKEEAGGQNVYVRQVGEALSRQGWQVDMFTRQSDANQPTIVQHSRQCRTIRLTAGPKTFIPRDELFTYMPEFVQSFQRFQAENEVQYPLAHTHYWMSGWVGMELRKLQSLKLLHTYHSLGAVKYQSIPKTMIAETRLATEKACLESAERIIATSPQERDHMRSLVSSYGNIDVIPCGTDIRRFGSVSRAKARQQLGIPQDQKVVLYVGRFDRRKGIETAVRAVGHSALRDQNLKLIVGGGSRPGQSDGIERERIEDIVAELGLQEITTFPGRLGNETLHLYYAAADVCLVPSHYEPFGLVAIEAMASNTPVIASDVGGLQYTVIPEVTGLLAPPKDDRAFATGLDRILANPTWRDQLGRAGRKRVEEKFSWDGVASQLGDLYTQVMQEQPAKKRSVVSA
jgi:D-inositol-3-phosphate glycosyltransferase